MSPPKRPADEKITQVIEKKILIHLHPGNDTDGRHPVNSPVEVGSWNPMIYKVCNTIQTVIGLRISEASVQYFTQN